MEMESTLGDTNTNDQNDNPKDLRSKLEAALAEINTLKTTVSTYQQKETLRDAGLSHLSDRQRRTLLRELEEDKLDLTADNVKKVVAELGFPAAPETNTPPPTDNGQQQTQGDDNGQQQPDPSQLSNDSLDGFTVMEQASIGARSGNIDPAFEEKMKKAKNPAELTSLIRSAEGRRAGLVHGWDTQ